MDTGIHRTEGTVTKRYASLAVVALLITYGSLYPFNFAAPPNGVFARLFSELDSMGSRGDILGNIGLFLPWGVIGILVLPPRKALYWTAASSFAIASGLQIAQVWTPTRTPALYDVIWNMVGCAIGVAFGHYMRGRRQLLSAKPAGAAFLLAAWMLVEWLPLVPSLDLQLIKDHLKALLALDSLDFGQLSMRLALTLLFGELLVRTCKPIQSLFLLPVVVLAIVSGKLIIVDASLTASAVLGHLCGVIAWYGIFRLDSDRRSALVVVALIGAYSIQALSPFALKIEPSSFGFLPFDGMLQGSMLDNARSLATSLLLFGSVLLLLRDSGSKTSVTSVGLALWVFLLEALQMFIASRSASITEPLLVLIAGFLVTSMDSASRTEPVMPHSEPEVRPEQPHGQPVRAISGQRYAAGVAVVVVLIVVALKILLSMPAVPYNVKELFRGDGNILALALFALALLWIGLGSVWLGRSLLRSAYPALLFPPMTVLVGLISLALLWSGVTSESVSDIAGASNRFWFVTNRNVWGDFWRDLFLYLDAPGAIGFLETCVRYWALYTPLSVCLGLLVYAFGQKTDNRHGWLTWSALAGSVCLLLWLCKAIAFDWSSTDNLNELIARDGEWGWGGGGYLYGLLFLICLNAMLLANISGSGLRRIATPLLFSVAAIPLGWWLLNHGLEQNVEKYDRVFSGVQFLLGPDRSHALSQNVLFLRWSLVQILGTLVIGTGLRVGLQVGPQFGPRLGRPWLGHPNAADAVTRQVARG
jgi:VanZ family protein